MTRWYWVIACLELAGLGLGVLALVGSPTLFLAQAACMSAAFTTATALKPA